MIVLIITKALNFTQHATLQKGLIQCVTKLLHQVGTISYQILKHLGFTVVIRLKKFMWNPFFTR